MAGETDSISVSGSFPVLIRDINLGAYKIQYEAQVIRHLCKPLGKGEHGDALNYTYWDPNADSAAGTATEGTDISATNAYINATVTLSASEFYDRSFITYNVSEDQKPGSDITGEHKRRHGYSHAIKMETKLAALFSGFTTNTITATSTSGMDIGNIMDAATLLDARKGLVPKPYNFVGHSYALNNLWKAMTTNSNYGVQGEVGEEVLKAHWKGRLLGEVDMYTSNQITISSSVAVCGMFAKDALGLWIPRPFKLEVDKDISYRAYERVSTQRMGCSVLHEGFGVAMSVYAGKPA